MSCSDDDFPDAQATYFPRARKQHECCACEHVIEPGQVYRVESGVWDGRPERYVYCARCSLLIDAICGTPGNQGFIHGLGCGHSWREVFDADPSPDVAALAFASPSDVQAQVQHKPAPRRRRERVNAK